MIRVSLYTVHVVPKKKKKKKREREKERNKEEPCSMEEATKQIVGIINN